MWRPEGATVDAAAPLLWCLPLFRPWHVLGQKGRAKQIGSTRNGAEPLLTSLPTSRIAPASVFANRAGGRYAIVLELGVFGGRHADDLSRGTLRDAGLHERSGTRD